MLTSERALLVSAANVFQFVFGQFCHKITELQLKASLPQEELSHIFRRTSGNAYYIFSGLRRASLLEERAPLPGFAIDYA